MSFLYVLEDLRNPVLDTIMSLITELGGEAIFIVLALFVFWCVDKVKGYYLLSIGFFGTVLNQFLKLLFRIPRPWVLDPNFTIVESARAEATGYSFPSGHTQNAVGTMGGAARFVEKKWLRIVLIVLALLVSFSRMYLGVHTPLDVGVSLVIATALIFLLYPMVEKANENPRIMYVMFSIMLTMAVGFLLFTELYAFPADVDLENLASGQKNAYTLVGALMAIFVASWADQKWLHFPTKAVWWAQIIKLVAGLGLSLAVKSGLKAPLLALFNGHPVAHLVRYFLMVLVAGVVWPMTFKWFSKLGQKK